MSFEIGNEPLSDVSDPTVRNAGVANVHRVAVPFCVNEQNTANVISKEISRASTDACNVDSTAIVCDESKSDFVAQCLLVTVMYWLK